MLKVGIVGGTGYTGVELLRLLLDHPEVDLCGISSRGEAGRAVADFFPSLRGRCTLRFTEPKTAHFSGCDVVFFATPHGVAMHEAPALLQAGVRVIDLSADFRLRDAALWQQWYREPHSSPALLEEAVYGLPEIFRAQIAQARLVANPGCYPTAVLLGLLPLLEAGAIDWSQTVIADCKSGVSGAGRKAEPAYLHGEVSENFRAYGLQGHRHYPEIVQGIEGAVRGKTAAASCNEAKAIAADSFIFLPHLLPMIRGMQASLYVPLHAVAAAEAKDWPAVYAERYRNEDFVDVLPAGQVAETRHVRGSNRCQMTVQRAAQGNRVIVLSVIDNLMKGAAGQAVQNMNLMFGFAQTQGLMQIPVVP